MKLESFSGLNSAAANPPKQQKDLDNVFKNKSSLSFDDIQLFVKKNEKPGFFKKLFNKQNQAVEYFKDIAADENKFKFISSLDNDPTGLSIDDMNKYFEFDEKSGYSSDDEKVLDTAIELWDRNNEGITSSGVFKDELESQAFITKLSRNYLNLRNQEDAGNIVQDKSDRENFDLSDIKFNHYHNKFVANIVSKDYLIDTLIDNDGNILSKSVEKRSSKLTKDRDDKDFNKTITNYDSNGNITSVIESRESRKYLDYSKDGKTIYLTKDEDGRLYTSPGGEKYYFDGFNVYPEKELSNKATNPDGAIKIVKDYLKNRAEGKINLNGYQAEWKYDYNKLSQLLDKFIKEDKIKVIDSESTKGLYMPKEDKILFNGSFIQNSTDEQIAETLFHELIHAQQSRDKVYNENILQKNKIKDNLTYNADTGIYSFDAYSKPFTASREENAYTEAGIFKESYQDLDYSKDEQEKTYDYVEKIKQAYLSSGL